VNVIAIEFENERITLRTEEIGAEGASLKEASLRVPASPLPLGCQKGRCGTCLVRVVGGAGVVPPNAIERAYLANHRIEDPELRLGCQLRINGRVRLQIQKPRPFSFATDALRAVTEPLPNIGFSTNVLDNPPDVVASVSRLARDFGAIELELGDRAADFVEGASAETYEATARAIREICAERGVALSVHAPYVGENLASADAGIRRAAQDRMRWAITVTRDFGSDKLTFHPGYHDGGTASDTVPSLLGALEPLVKLANERGVTLCLEKMGDERPEYIVYSAAEQAAICARAGVRVALDVVHLASLSVGCAFDDELDQLLPFIGNVHFADMHVPRHIHIPLGQGTLPFPKILAAIRRGGYRGPAIVEEFGGPYRTETYIERAREFRRLAEAAA
jgi:sugar phosphate isomerase/epimerase/ferredoxin